MGLKSGQILKIFVDNPFPIPVRNHTSMRHCIICYLLLIHLLRYTICRVTFFVALHHATLFAALHFLLTSCHIICYVALFALLDFVCFGSWAEQSFSRKMQQPPTPVHHCPSFAMLYLVCFGSCANQSCLMKVQQPPTPVHHCPSFAMLDLVCFESCAKQSVTK